jgi:hypothetical protein
MASVVLPKRRSEDLEARNAHTAHSTSLRFGWLCQERDHPWWKERLRMFEKTKARQARQQNTGKLHLQTNPEAQATQKHRKRSNAKMLFN